ncbi:MAG: hypothetical protein ABMA13_19755 [Chthoniobacteraceae bacterium]
MKRLLIIVLAALALGAATYFLCFRMATVPMRQMASVNNELVWLATEFHLSPEQTKRVEQLHSAYEPRCMTMCRKIAENSAQLDRLITTKHEFTPEMERLLRDSAEIQIECRREMLTHIYAVAAVMPPEQGARYIELLKMQVLQPGTPHAPPAAGHAHE